MRTATVLIASASFLVSFTNAHSWLECTDYRITPNSADSKVWNKEKCFGHARCGKRQEEAGFGVDTGFNYHSSEGCQCPRSPDNYNGITKATYTPGQRVCIAYPPKNHVAAPCTNEYIPDTGTVITRSSLNPSSDATSSYTKQYENRNGKHEKGQVDYKGFQNCPNFCADKEKSLCTMCFDLEHDIAPGEYSFKWMWSFNSEQDTYSTCWEATVVGGNTPENAPGPSPAPQDSTTSPVVGSVTTKPGTSSPSVAPEPHSVEPGKVNEDDCEEDLPQPGEDCDEDLPQAGDNEDCDEPLPVPHHDGYNTPAQQPAPAPGLPTSTPAPSPTNEAGNQKQEDGVVPSKKPENNYGGNNYGNSYGNTGNNGATQKQEDAAVPSQKPENNYGGNNYGNNYGNTDSKGNNGATQNVPNQKPENSGGNNYGTSNNPGNSYGNPDNNGATQKPEDAKGPSQNPEDRCGVEEDEPTQEGPGSVHSY